MFGKVVIYRNGKPIGFGYGTFTRQARNLLQVLFLEFGTNPVVVEMRDINNQLFQIVARGRVDASNIYHIYLVSNADLPSETGLKFYLCNVSQAYTPDSTSLVNPKVSGTFTLRLVRDTAASSALVFYSTFTSNTDEDVNSVAITASLLDSNGNVREVLIDVISINAVRLAANTSYDIMYTIQLV